MDVDRELIVQVGISVTVVAIFIAALALISGSYGQVESADNHSLDGTLEGELSEMAETNESYSAEFFGEFENEIQATFDGQLNGTVDDGTFQGTYAGSIDGAIEGNASGDVEGEIDDDEDTFEGTFNGSANGTTSKSLTDQGGLVLVGLIAAFIIAMPIFGYFIEWFRDDEDE